MTLTLITLINSMGFWGFGVLGLEDIAAIVAIVYCWPKAGSVVGVGDPGQGGLPTMVGGGSAACAGPAEASSLAQASQFLN